jgi:hypothetical protein
MERWHLQPASILELKVPDLQCVRYVVDSGENHVIPFNFHSESEGARLRGINGCLAHKLTNWSDRRMAGAKDRLTADPRRSNRYVDCHLEKVPTNSAQRHDVLAWLVHLGRTTPIESV